MFSFKKCDGCEKDLQMGSAKYNVRVEITSDFDGFLPDYEDDEDAAMCSVLDHLGQMSAEELEQDVHLEAEMTLCKACRDRLVDSIEGLRDEDDFEPKSKCRANLH
jgi:hypothetical protein